nr:Arm DNA-binding domain-containing protein [uncultured Dyadobacter sp.]
MKTKLSLLFYLKKPRNYQDGPVPIYLRVTVDSKRSEMATGRDCEPKMWNAAAGRMLGNKEAVKSLNAYLGNLEQQFLNSHASLIRQGDLATAENIKNKFLGIGPKQRMLMSIITEHNRRLHTLIGQEYALGTFKGTRSCDATRKTS